jgi:hypothetical protein
LAGLLNGYPWSPLPNANAYWSYPINSNNREWNQISGDWLGMASTGAIINSATCRLWQPYGSGPNTGHIVWKYTFRMGGVAGGDFGTVSYGAINSRLSTTILQGKVYQNIEYANKFVCIDLASGKVLYTMNGTIDYGYHNYMNPNLQAGYSPTGNVVLESSYGNTPVAYLIQVSGSTWTYWDPLTGAVVRQITNASSGFRFIDGMELAYGIRNNKMVRWNMTKVPTTGTSANNWATGTEWEKPVPNSLVDPLNKTGGNAGSIIDAIFAISSDASTIMIKASPAEYRGYSAETGASLWNLTINYPTTANQQIRLYPKDYFVVIDVTESTFKCYSILTGALLWTSTSFNDAVWATTWTVYLSSTNDNDNFYVTFPDGTARAYSMKDGHEVWRSKAIPSTEYPNNAVPYVQSMLMVGGKIYAYAGYSSSYKINPIPRHSMIVCINAANGDIIYTLNGGPKPSAAADGYVIATGDHDGNLYCLGKGPTSTTVTAQQQVGGSVLIQGSVLDTSEVSSSATLTAKFANGVPAISDENMSVWMDYLHMQNATLLNNPPICTGVPVTLTAVDPNGNVDVIGTATTNYLGNYQFQWTPTTQGLYTIYATFTGSNSYYTSSASSGATVSAASAPIPTPTSTVQSSVSNSDMLMYLAITAIAIIIAIAVVGALILRKK